MGNSLSSLIVPQLFIIAATLYAYHGIQNLLLWFVKGKQDGLRKKQSHYDRMMLGFSASFFSLTFFLTIWIQDLYWDNIANMFLMFFGVLSTYYYSKTLLHWIHFNPKFIKRFLWACRFIVGLNLVKLLLCLSGHTDLLYTFEEVPPSSAPAQLLFGSKKQVLTPFYAVSLMTEICAYLMILGCVLYGWFKRLHRDPIILGGSIFSVVSIVYEFYTFHFSMGWYFPVVFASFYPELFRVTILAQRKTMLELGQLRTITAKKIENARLESVEQMAAGLAHEMNNPLAIIQGYLYRLKTMMDTDDPSVERVFQRCDLSIARMASITQTLTNLTDRNFDRVRVVSLESLMDIPQKMFIHRFAPHKNSSIEIAPPPKHWISCDVEAVQMAILEVLNNAWEATQGNDGEIPKVKVSFVIKDMAEVRISDNGPGFSKQESTRLLNPFYTTKKVGEGLGLGLSRARAAISRSRGNLTLSRHGASTVAIIALPLANKPSN